MQVTYSAELIKKVVQSDVFLDYRRIIESGESLPYKDLAFVSKDRLDEFLCFVEKLIFLSRESRLDGITFIQVEFDEIIFLDELEISLVC